MPAAVHLSLAEARQIGLRAQGFGSARPARPNLGHVRRVVCRLGAVQIDAVNVLVRAHYLPVFSRLGPYDRGLFDRLAFRAAGAFEGVAHAASFVPMELYGALRWRQAQYATNKYWVAGQAAIESRNPGYIEKVVAEIAERGPLSFKELADPARYERPKTKYAESSLLWWSRRPSDGKHVLEGLWREGRLAVAGRRAGFERAFDLAERVIPSEILAAPVSVRDVAHGALIRHAAHALGVGWLKDFADFFRMPVADTKPRLRELVEDGVLVTAIVEGRAEPAYLDPAVPAGPVSVRALLSPFDSLLWERARNVRLFGFRHSFEIYVPEAARTYGYYVLPFLLDDAIVGRVDLKADRSSHTLVVQGAYAEPGVSAPSIVAPLATALRETAGWLELEAITVRDNGGLAPPLRRALNGRAG
jgi:hypothetical protein